MRWGHLVSLSSSLLRFGDLKEEEVRRHEGASSDGYLAHVFRHAAKELFNEDVGEVTYRARRCVPACWGLCWGLTAQSRGLFCACSHIYFADLPDLDWK